MYVIVVGAGIVFDAISHMMRWIIIRTRAGREAAVSLDIQCAGRMSWFPREARRYRTAKDRKLYRCSIRYVPVLPRHVLACVDLAALPALLDLRDVEAVVRDAEGRIVTIPNAQVGRFRREIDAHNAHVFLSDKYRPKRKPRWQALDASSLKQTLGELFGNTVDSVAELS
jgi:hypothetical protein